jgi:hypothetical protein
MIHCSDCHHFQRAAINPEAAMGRCMHEMRHGYWHPEAPHSCRDHEKVKEPPKDE